jgi:GR25 family glycosyltransferase involved in LPS biosynthesis
MTLNKFCYKVFHIPGYGESHEQRSDLFKSLDDFLLTKMDRLETDTVLISNEDQYFDFNEKHNLIKTQREFKWGELGIWASNLLAIKNFLNTDKEYLMLMEDDIYVPNQERFVELLEYYMSIIPKDWEVFSYFVHENQFTRFQDIHGHSEIVPAYQDWSMLCYILNRKSAEKILNLCLIHGLTMPIDWYIYRQPEVFKSYTLSPIAEKGCKLYNVVSTFQEKETGHPVPEKRNK